MSIKTMFNPMGGEYGEPKPIISEEWLYTTRTNEKNAKVRTLYFYNNAIGGDEVVVPYGHTELQDYDGSTNNSYSTLPFYNHHTLISVDLKNVPFRNNNMSNAFRDCLKLTSVNNINQNVTDMSNAFRNCVSFNQNIQIPYSVTDIDNTFCECYDLNQNIQIPNSVKSMDNTFYYCDNLAQNIQIPNSVVYMYNTFSRCYKLDQNIQIPNSVRYMQYAFYWCNNLNQNIQIPNSVKSIDGTFRSCHNLNQNIQIPDSVAWMNSTFLTCHNMGTHNKWINISGTAIAGINDCFQSTSAYNTLNQLRVVIPCRYINNAFTYTYNSLLNYYSNATGTETKTAITFGNGQGVTQANDTQLRNILCFDDIGGDWTYIGDGTNNCWKLTKWVGTLQRRIQTDDLGMDFPVESVTVKGYRDYPSKLAGGCFSGCTALSTIDMTGCAGFYPGSLANTFRNCQNLDLLQIKNIYNFIPDGVTSIADMFRNCVNLYNPPALELPDTCTTASGVFAEMKSCGEFRISGNYVTTLSYAFDYCNTHNVTIWAETPRVTNIVNWFRGYSTSFRKFIYIPFLFSNGVNTPMFNCLKPVLYSGSSGNGQEALESGYMYNSVSNFYIQDSYTYPD